VSVIYIPPRPELGSVHPHAFTFYLGTHKPQHLRSSPVPLFLSYSELSKRKRLGVLRARTYWAMDSGGFTQLGRHGRWTVEPERYADDVRRYMDEIGGLQWAAIQDWMVEPHVRTGAILPSGQKKLREGKNMGDLRPYFDYFPGTKLDLEYHQELTVSSYLELNRIAPDVPWAPVLQGWTMGDYFRCVELYARAGVDLYDAPAVGVGSVCRRQATTSAGLMLSLLSNEEHGYGLTNLHGFGFKTDGLPFAARFLGSADSTAWSYDARRLKGPGVPGHVHGKTNKCNNCLDYALVWRERMIRRLVGAGSLPDDQALSYLDAVHNSEEGVNMVVEDRQVAAAEEERLCSSLPLFPELPPEPSQLRLFPEVENPWRERCYAPRPAR
jgi:hypothetical protein